MRLRHVTIQGFQNLRAPVVLDELPDVVVLHGANNVGKSNVLEALELGFRLLGWAPAEGQEPTAFDAEAHAHRVGDGDWQARKARALSQALRVPVPDPPPRVPATVDGFIGAHARVLISNDAGAEHTRDELRRVRVDALEAALGLG